MAIELKYRNTQNRNIIYEKETLWNTYEINDIINNRTAKCNQLILRQYLIINQNTFAFLHKNTKKKGNTI